MNRKPLTVLCIAVVALAGYTTWIFEPLSHAMAEEAVGDNKEKSGPKCVNYDYLDEQAANERAEPAVICLFTHQSVALRTGDRIVLMDYPNYRILAMRHNNWRELNIEVMDIDDEQAVFKAWVPGLNAQVILHREIRSCETDELHKPARNEADQYFPAGGDVNYSNYTCSGRYQRHCIGDGTYDTYYEEDCVTPGSADDVIPIVQGKSVRVYHAVITIEKIGSTAVTISVKDLNGALRN